MLIGKKFCRTVAAALTCAALLTGCTAGQGHKIRLPKLNCWPQSWGRPSTLFSKPYQPAQPEYQPEYQQQSEPEYMPVPADPSGSPYPPNSPRGLYIPSPAPGSKLGLPVPPPLPPGEVEASPAPEGLGVPEPESEALPVPIPPAAGDGDVSYDVRRPQRPTVAPPPPREPEDSAAHAPRLAERTDRLDRRRQPVDLELPELETEPALPQEVFPDEPGPGRSPVEAFPRPRTNNENLERGPGHTPALEDTDEALPKRVDPSAHRPTAQRQGPLPGPLLPVLRDPPETDLAFPGGHRQMSGEQGGRFVKVDQAVSRLGVQRFCLTRDARSGDDAEVLSARNLRRGQELVVQTDIVGLEKIQRSGELASRITCHAEICDTLGRVLHRTDKQHSTEVSQSAESVRHVTLRMTIPSRLKAGEYVLQLHVQDNIARQVTVVEMPVAVRS